MPKHWYQISSRQDKHWTVATWVVFAGLTLSLAAALLFLTGAWDTWRHFLGLCFENVTQSPSGGLRRQQGWRLVPLFVGSLWFFLPVVFAVIPALAILLWLMRWAHRDAEPPKRAATMRGGTHVIEPPRRRRGP